MICKIIITFDAKRQLEAYVGYVKNKLHNKQAARKIIDDANQTFLRLISVAESLAYCEDEVLKKKGYRKIQFDKHDFFMVYRIENDTVIVDAMYHMLQDVNDIFN